jgi:TonB family protein
MYDCFSGTLMSLEDSLNSRSLLVAASFFAALAGTAGTASAASSVAAGCENQSNAPIVVHRALPDSAASSYPSPARAVLAVHLARTGRSSTVLLSRSSGSSAFDQAALAAAKASSFAPAARSCVAHDATFQYAIARESDGRLTTAVVGVSGN